MKVHWLQHVPFEGLGAMEPWFCAHGHELSCTRLYLGEPVPPDPGAFDWLVVMGGPMNIYQHRDYPWLKPEKRLIEAAIRAGKRVLGVCLGAQLIADVLGGKICQNPEREIGWFPLRAVAPGVDSAFGIPPGITVLHWHGDTFSLPAGSVWLAASEACPHQAFAYGRRVLALQFHLEMTAADRDRILQACAGELSPARFVQTAAEIAAGTPEAQDACLRLLHELLAKLADAD